jgi:adenylate kinase family enzyme
MAAKLNEWLGEFIAEHQARFPRPDWPGAEDRTFWATWHSHFLRAGLLHREVASEASERLALDPPAFLDNHLPKLVEIAQQVYREHHQRGQILDTNTREAAERASRGCDCGGSGLVSIRDEHGQGFGAYCPDRCPMQRWVEQQHRERVPLLPGRSFVASHRFARLHTFYIPCRARRLPRGLSLGFVRRPPVSADDPVTNSTPAEAEASVADRAAGEERPDDEESTVRHRLNVYRENTAPLIDSYQQAGVPIHRVDGDRAIDAVQKDVLSRVGN